MTAARATRMVASTTSNKQQAPRALSGTKFGKWVKRGQMASLFELAPHTFPYPAGPSGEPRTDRRPTHGPRTTPPRSCCPLVDCHSFPFTLTSGDSRRQLALPIPSSRSGAPMCSHTTGASCKVWQRSNGRLLGLPCLSPLPVVRQLTPSTPMRHPTLSLISSLHSPPAHALTCLFYKSGSRTRPRHRMHHTIPLNMVGRQYAGVSLPRREDAHSRRAHRDRGGGSVVFARLEAAAGLEVAVRVARRPGPGQEWG